MRIDQRAAALLFHLIKQERVEINRAQIAEHSLSFLGLGIQPPDPSWGAMLARCAKDDNWYEVVDTLYGQDGEWAHATSPLEGLRGLLTKSLMSNAQFEACLSDQALQDKITSVARGGTIAGVTSTPTFFINGKKYQGYMTTEIFGQILDNLL
ncbi:MAG: hypothetical protein B7Z22_10830 [Hyphomonas sp. 32-62-5]|nr:MAG: hypothetical protein B7Z22_10830 [Hyphomonas sp. 32-62-5]